MIYDLLSSWKDITMERLEQMLLHVGSVLKDITPSKRRLFSLSSGEVRCQEMRVDLCQFNCATAAHCATGMAELHRLEHGEPRKSQLDCDGMISFHGIVSTGVLVPLS
jgi:hypothetical protein